MQGNGWLRRGLARGGRGFFYRLVDQVVRNPLRIARRPDHLEAVCLEHVAPGCQIGGVLGHLLRHADAR